MIKNSKTKNLIRVLSTLFLSAVFVFSIGYTFAVATRTFSYSNSVGSTSAYLANSECVVKNDIVNIPYNGGFNNAELAIEYAVGYDFDIRLDYSLVWKNGSTNTALSTDNVVLNFVDRDKWIVDREHMYYANYSGTTPCGITAGTGKLYVLSGVSFIFENDEYIGKTLTLTVSQVKIAKAYTSSLTTHYTTSHALATDGSGDSKTAWLNYKTKNSSLSNKAFVVVNNPRYCGANGIEYPFYDSAYQTHYDDENSIIASSWLGGNRYYAGVGAYIVNGSSSLTLTVSVNLRWHNQSVEMTAINNLQANYSKDWTHKAWDEEGITETCVYHYLIPAYTCSYVNILDTYEITSCIKSLAANYVNCKAYVASVVINGVTFAFSDDTKFYQSGTITSSGESGISQNYSSKQISVFNNSNYNNGLFKSTYNQALSAQSFYSTVSLTNNTKQDAQVSVSYKLLFHVSNGYEILLSNSQRSNEFYNATNSYYFMQNEVTQNLTVVGNSGLTQTCSVPAGQTVQIAYQYSVGAGFYTYIQGLLDASFGGSDPNVYDVWVALVAEVTTVTSQTQNAVSAFVKQENGAFKLYATNNTNKKLTAVSADVIYVKHQMVYDEANPVHGTKPAYWMAQYWEYYTKVGSAFVRNTSSIFDATATYYLGSNIDNYLTHNYSASSLNILPNETVLLATLSSSEIATTDDVEFMVKNVQATINSTALNVSLVNAGKTDAYIQNFGSSSCYVRFGGTYTGSDSHIFTSDSYNYYIGLIRPGQIVKVPMSATGTLQYIVHSASVFTEDELNAAWANGGSANSTSTTVKNKFKAYFI